MDKHGIPILQRISLELQKRSNLQRAEIDRLRARVSSSVKETSSLRRGNGVKSHVPATVLLERSKQELHVKLLDIEALQKTLKYTDAIEAQAQLNIATFALEQTEAGTSVDQDVEILKRRMNMVSAFSRIFAGALIAAENEFIAAVTKRDILEQQNIVLSRKVEASSKSSNQAWLLSRPVFDACFISDCFVKAKSLREIAAKMKLDGYKFIDEVIKDDIGQ